MSFRLKSFLVAFQLSLVIWGAIFYAGMMLATSANHGIDQVYTASVR